MSASSTTSNSISFWNIVNLLAYLANAAIVYSVGTYGILGKGNNAELSAKYQTLITPAGYAFAIWALIFLAQFVWAAVIQLLWPRYRAKAIQYVHYYNYIGVCLAQIAWTLAFGLEIIWLSMIFMAMILFFLIRIVWQSRKLQSRQTSAWCEEYFFLEFPFTVHAGWIMAATLLNANVVLVYYNINVNVQFLAALASLVIVLVASSIFLALPDFTIPLVLIWALTGIYVELGNPQDSIRNHFSQHTVPLVQKAAGIAVLAIAVALLVRLYTSYAEYRQIAHSERQRSLQEPLTPTRAAAAANQQEQEHHDDAIN